MKTTFLVLFATILLINLKAQPIGNYFVCNVDGEAIDPDKMKDHPHADSDEELCQYLDEIKYIFNQPYARYTLQDIKNFKAAVAHIQLIGTDMARVISINKDYYNSKLTNEVNKEALFIWIIAHELGHHINGDLHYDMQGIVANNYRREILADEQAGYAVGMLTNIDIDFFDQELPSILRNKSDSKTHPFTEYRIFAAKAGWLQAKLLKYSRLNSASRIYKKQKSSDYDILGRFYNNNFNGIACFVYSNGDRYFGNLSNGEFNGKGILIQNADAKYCNIYLGDWVSNQKSGQGVFLTGNGDRYDGSWKKNLKEGKGRFLGLDGSGYLGEWKNDKMHGTGTFVWSNEESYKGNWVNGERSGHGIHEYSNGSKYRGNWENDQPHGDGLLYNGNNVIKAGCWQNGEYVGTECN